MGLSTFIVMYMATYNTTRISLNKGVFFNYEGAQTIQFILMLIVVGMPMVVYTPFSFLEYPTMGFVFIGMMGFSGIVFRNQLMSKVIVQFHSRKYKIASGFRIE